MPPVWRETRILYFIPAAFSLWLHSSQTNLMTAVNIPKILENNFDIVNVMNQKKELFEFRLSMKQKFLTIYETIFRPILPESLTHVQYHIIYEKNNGQRKYRVCKKIADFEWAIIFIWRYNDNLFCFAITCWRDCSGYGPERIELWHCASFLCQDFENFNILKFYLRFLWYKIICNQWISGSILKKLIH